MSELANETADQSADAANLEETGEESPRAVWASVGLFVAVAVLGSGCIGYQMIFN